MLKNKVLIAPLGLVGMTILSGAFLMSSYSFATDNTNVVDEINITVPISCAMSGTGMDTHDTNISNNTYLPNIGTTTIKVYCNDDHGFAIYAAGYTGDEIGGADSTKLVNEYSDTNNTIITGTATSGDTSNWAMKLSTNSGATYALTLDNGFGSYSAVPASYTKVAHRDSGTDIGVSATGASLTTTYAAYINSTQPAGTYTGKVIYTLVHPSSEIPAQPIACEGSKICYNPNTTTVAGEMGKQSAKAKDWSSCADTDQETYCYDSNWNRVNIDTLPELDYLVEEITLRAPNFKRSGYGFAGWNTAYDYSGITYGPQQTITIPNDTSTNGLSLYAVWVPSAGTLQNWSGCSGMSIGGVTALTDNRDNDTYAVAKLADGKCWMIENLRLDNVPELSSANTHNPSLPLTNSWYYHNSQTTLTTSNHLSPTVNPKQTYWCYDRNSNCIDQSMLATNNTVLFTNNTASNYNASSDVYSYGNYYNWYSATAGHGKYDSNYGSSYTALGDICPAGWHLPTGKNASGEFGVLDIAMGGTGSNQYTTESSNRWRSYPNNFVYSGFMTNNPAIINSLEDGRNDGSFYWSASGWSTVDAFSLQLDGTSLFPGTFSIVSRDAGETVRCVAGV